MSTTAGLHIDILNVDDSDSVSWDDTSLIKVEPVLALSLFLALKVLSYRMRLQDDSVSLILDLELYLFGD